ncbi:hypothetical protein [Actinomadura litoris]|uniref:Uncharacterized protein n=1 Tax=Actinomadura litoris TaxID=2678616 RepID=A0A7K1L3Q5_9ACTN|nr:hypothetical protein [Actinomadura litoris]MUN38896.1 hypothetical protein [Actinomadura litoris]
MADVFALRRDADDLRLRRDTAVAAADDHELWVRRLEERLVAGMDMYSHQLPTRVKLDAEREVQAQRRAEAADLESRLDLVRVELAAELGSGDPLFGSGDGGPAPGGGTTPHTPRNGPVALLPVRLETRFTSGGRQIMVRVYPDDLHVEAHDPRLTAAEAEAGRAYWADPGDGAWQRLLTTLSPARAAWTVRATRPGAAAPEIRPDGDRRPPRVTTLPDRWRFIGLTGGARVVDRTADEPVPAVLPLGLLASDAEPADWAVDFEAAVRAGMAATLTLPEGVEHLDELIAVGVRQEEPGPAAARLADLLLGHAYTDGLAFLPAGTPTNNTPETRSAWTSRPRVPPPVAEDPEPEPGTAAASLAAALGLPDARFLGLCDGADDATDRAIAGMCTLGWGALAQGFVQAATERYDLATLEPHMPDTEPSPEPDAEPDGGGEVPGGGPWPGIRDHLAEFVRSRGPLPTIRVGRQPYGVLPVAGLDEWRPAAGTGDAAVEEPIVEWALRLRHHWRAALAPGWIPRVGDGRPADRAAVDVLSRLPVATDLVIRRVHTARTTLEAADRMAPGPVLSVGGVPPESGLRWWVPSEVTSDLARDPESETTRLDFGRFQQQIAPSPDTYRELFETSRQRVADGLALFHEELSLDDYLDRWPMLPGGDISEDRPVTIFDIPESPELIPALLATANWDFLPGGSGDDPVRLALSFPLSVDSWVQLRLPDAPGTPDLVEGARETVRDTARGAPRIIEGLDALARARAEDLGPLLLEVFDVLSHRLDAWITSLAARRLAASPPGAGVRIGGYGWVEDLRPGEEQTVTDVPGVGEVSVSPADGYIHAPSLHHAATAAVLRSGFLAHEGDRTLAVDLTSRRARTARWLVRGVRNGQNLGTLLGYRFERALHDAGLDALVPVFRRGFPAPAVPEPPPLDDSPSDLWANSHEAIADRNVVDGLALARAAASGEVGEQGEAAPHLADLVDALDAVGDALLAEGVHHLIGGNALRAGMAADTLGRGQDVPDRFEVLTTPHRGRAVTQRLALALPDAPAPAPGWPADALTALEPRLDAWVSGLLGPASELRLSGTVTATGEEFTQTADRLGMGALALVLDASSGDRPRLTRKGTRRLHGEGWDGLRELAVRLRTLLASAQPLVPAHLLPPDAAPVPVDLAETRARATAYKDAVTAAGTDPDRLAALGVTAADPAAAAARLGAALGGTPGEDWLRQVTEALSALLGARLPLAPRLTGAALGPRPAGATGSAVGAWLRRYAAVRPAARAWYEALLLTGGTGDQVAAQEPMRTLADPWIGGTFDPDDRPPARWHLVCHLPRPIGAGEPLAGIVLDEWTEALPGADGAVAGEGEGEGPHELTGLAFHYDRPDAKAPQAVLIAVPPDPERGWTPDVLALAVHDTLELAKLRAVDLGDLPLLDNLLPGVTTVRTSTVSGVLATFEENAGVRILDPLTGEPRFPLDDMYRLEPLHRSTEVASGLAARIHDPAWMLTRQWQFGEFAGQDAGSPIDVELIGESRPITAWRPPDGPWTPYDPRLGPLEPRVESEPPVVDDRARAEGGAQFVAMLAESGLSEALPGLLAEFGLRPGPGGLVGLLDGRVPDAAALAAAIDAGRLAGDGLADVARRWRDWWAEAVPRPTPDTFDGHRFEHRLALAAGGTVLTAEEYLGDGLDWYSLDADPDLPGPAADGSGPPRPLHARAFPSPVRYGGIPADRFWEAEDAAVDLGSVEVDALDTGRLLLLGFATTYGNDWFTLPVEVPAGSLTTLTSLLVTDTFGRRHLIGRAGRDDPSWNMFTLHGAPDGLLMMPAAADMPGPPLETVSLTRDELANLGWAIEHTVTDGRGELLDRRAAWTAPTTPVPEGPSYAVQTIVPDYWLPLVPEAAGVGAIRFRLVGLTQPGIASGPRGRLLTEGTWLHEEEVPREGCRVTRRPVLSRWTDGSWHAWIRREKTTGTGEGSSGLAFDVVRPSESWPL